MGCTGCGACCDNLGFDLNGKRMELETRAGEPDDSRNSIDARFILAHWRMREDATDAWDTTCDLYDPITRRCGDYEHRPPVCSDYPYYSDGPNLARLDMLPERCGYRDDWQPIELTRTPARSAA